MIDKTTLTKRYYSITEVSQLFDVTNSLLRYWEGEFRSLKPVKGRNGIRRYTVKDIETIQKIYQLVKERGFTIDGAKKELKSAHSKPRSTDSIHQNLLQLKKRLEDLRATLGEGLSD